jgi:hypothetical protein
MTQEQLKCVYAPQFVVFDLSFIMLSHLRPCMECLAAKATCGILRTGSNGWLARSSVEFGLNCSFCLQTLLISVLYCRVFIKWRLNNPGKRDVSFVFYAKIRRNRLFI